MINGKQCTILLYVDDMLCMHKSKEVVNGIYDEIDKKYGKGKRSDGKVISFLGMQINLDEPGALSISMPKLIDDLLKEWNITDG